jgi:hypothetical protein
MKTQIKINTKTTFKNFNVDIVTVGKSASEKLNALKKVEKILNENNGKTTSFESLPYSKGGRYARHTSTLYNTTTFVFNKYNNFIELFNSSKSANCPSFSIIVYSDASLNTIHNELLKEIEIANKNLDLFKKGLGFDYLQNIENEKRIAIENIESEKRLKEAERKTKVDAGYIFIESLEDFKNKVWINDFFLKNKSEISKLNGIEKNQKQREFFNSFLQKNKIEISNEKLFWACWTSIK